MYKLLTDKLGNDTTDAMFNYIDNKTERSVEASIKTLATKHDIMNVKEDIAKVKEDLKEDIAKVNLDLSIRIGDMAKWMFIFWVGQLGAMIGFGLLFLKK